MRAPIETRYARAAAQTPVRSLPLVAGIGLYGYWLDEAQFFFLAQDIDPARRCIIETPMIAHAERGEVKTVITRAALLDLLGACNLNFNEATLDAAQIDMPAPDKLAIVSVDKAFIVDVRQNRVTIAQIGRRGVFSSHHVAFVDGDDVWVADRTTGAERAITTGGQAHCRYARLPENSVSTISERKAPSTLGEWSHDGAWFLTHLIDERGTPEIDLVQHAPEDGGVQRSHRIKYSAYGEDLPLYRIVAIHPQSRRKIESTPAPLQLFSPIMARQAWFVEKTKAAFLRNDRFKKRCDLVTLDLETGAEEVALTEQTDQGYLEAHPVLGGPANVRVLPKSQEVIWYSERDGWGHLYLYDAATGRVKNQITHGAWQVRDIVHVDTETRTILFTAGGVRPGQDCALRSLCRCNLDGSGFTVLLHDDGDVAAVPDRDLDQTRPFRPPCARSGASPSGRFVVVQVSHAVTGAETLIVDTAQGARLSLAHASDAAPAPPPRLFSAVAADGETPLFGALFVPRDFDPAARYPLIDIIYPGPQIPWAPRGFRQRNSAIFQALAEIGFIVAAFDTRGMPFRSRAVHQAGYGHLLEPQLADHAAVVRELCRRHAFIDPERIGIMGVSGGGLATARALFSYADLYKVGVSIAGNHNSRAYRSMWMDTYVGPAPAEGEEPNLAFAHALRGKLFLISGDMDENVPLSQTLQLADALIRANKDFELLVSPNEGHLVLVTHGYTQRRVWDFFVRHLLGEEPPQEFDLRFSAEDLAAYGRAMAREARL